MTRIVAGLAGGRRLAVPPGSATRPTSDRAREGLFSTLEALRGPLAGARVLDLYAGSGALGLEAVSRGAAAVTLVEAQPRALTVLRANVTALDLPGATVVADRVERWLTGPALAAYDVVLADPPYALPGGELDVVLSALATRNLLAAGGLVAVERPSRETFRWPPGWTALRTRRYGEATLWYGAPGEMSGGRRCRDGSSARDPSTR